MNNLSTPPKVILPKIDIHVNIIGNGKQGSGCRTSIPLWQTPLVRIMGQSIGLNISMGDPLADLLYQQKLAHWIRTSSLDQAVILACDNLYDEAGRCHTGKTAIYVPNDYVLKLAEMCPQFLAGVSIHPARPDAIEELERCASQGAKLVKLLPCVQSVDCNRSQYRSFWRRMAELNLSLLAHTGGEISMPVNRPDLESVDTLLLPLKSGVNVIAAHCGTRAIPGGRDHLDQFLKMRDVFGNLYGDIAALSQVTHLRTLEKLRENPRRILYGSDYPVVTSIVWARLKGWISKEETSRLQRIKNPMQKGFEFTKALGFPETIFTDFNRIVNAPQIKR